jgi:hypothetical protein
MKKYNVLWFDDKFESLTNIQESSFTNNIILNGFTNADEGIKELELNFHIYDAVIVDGIFYHKATESGDATKETAFGEVAKFLIKLENTKKIPWFVLSGQEKFTKTDNSLLETFKNNKFYDKLNEQHITSLWSDIKNEADKQIETQIRHKYQRAFEVCTDKYIGSDTVSTLLDLLKTIEGEIQNQNTEDKLNAIRKIIEKLFYAFHDLGILPIEVLKGNGGINNSSKFLAGYHPAYKYNEEILPPILASHLKNILQITQDGSHAEGDLSFKVHDFIKQISTPYLFNSIIFQLLDLLIWFKDFSDKNQVKIKNANFTELIENKTGINHEGIIQQDSNRNYYCDEYLLNYNFVNSNYKLGEKIMIVDASENIQLKTKDIYKKFATKFIKL